MGKNTIGMNFYKKDVLIVYVTPETWKELFVAASFIWVLISMFCFDSWAKTAAVPRIPQSEPELPSPAPGCTGAEIATLSRVCYISGCHLLQGVQGQKFFRPLGEHEGNPGGVQSVDKGGEKRHDHAAKEALPVRGMANRGPMSR